MGFTGSVYQQEFIGARINVLESTYDGYQDLSGKVVDETKNMLTIEDQNGFEKKIPKEGTTFKLYMNDFEGSIEGHRINERPEDRIKKSG